jgi:hypothetical protein
MDMNRYQRDRIIRRGAEVVLLLLGCLIGWSLGLLAWLAVSGAVAGVVSVQWTGAHLVLITLASVGSVFGGWAAGRIIRAADRNTGRAQETP